MYFKALKDLSRKINIARWDYKVSIFDKILKLWEHGLSLGKQIGTCNLIHSLLRQVIFILFYMLSYKQNVQYMYLLTQCPKLRLLSQWVTNSKMVLRRFSLPKSWIYRVSAHPSFCCIMVYHRISLFNNFYWLKIGRL